MWGARRPRGRARGGAQEQSYRYKVMIMNDDDYYNDGRHAQHERPQQPQPHHPHRPHTQRGEGQQRRQQCKLKLKKYCIT